MISLSKLFRRPPKLVEPDSEVAGPPAPVDESPLMLHPDERTIIVTVGAEYAGKKRLAVPQLPDSALWDLAGFHLVTEQGRRRYGGIRPMANTVEVDMRDGLAPQADEFAVFTFRRVPDGAVSVSGGTVRTDAT